MRHYSVDDFLNSASSTPYKVEVEKKISLLYDFYILKRTRKCSDSREEDVRRVFLTYKTSIRLDNAVHGIFTGDYTLDSLLSPTA